MVRNTLVDLCNESNHFIKEKHPIVEVLFITAQVGVMCALLLAKLTGPPQCPEWLTVRDQISEESVRNFLQ